MVLLRGCRIYTMGLGKEVPWVPSSRMTMALLQFIGCICMYLMRVNMSVGIVCMTEDEEDKHNTTDVGDSVMETEKEHFDWDRKTSGLVLSSFFIGYLIMQIPAGWLAPKLGGKYPVFFGMLLLIVLSSLSPTAARAGPYYLVAVQILKGIACGPFYPSLQHLWSYWAPPLERSKLTAFAMSGSAIGSVLSFSFSALLCKSSFAGGWPSVFYVYAMVSVVWLILWGIFIFDTPSSHPRIDESERDYIETSLGNSDIKAPPVPWCSLLTSVPFYAIVVADFAYGWGWYTAQTSLPLYMHDVLEFPIAENGALMSIPYLVSWAAAVVAAIAADAMLNSGKFTVTWARKIFETLGLLVPAFFVMAVGFLDKTQSAWAVTFLTIAVGLLGCVRVGHIVNQLDIAPRYVGIIMAISNSMNTVAGILAPIVTASLTPNKTQGEWRNVFYLCGGVFVAGWLVFTLFARGQLESWASILDEPCDESLDVDRKAGERGSVNAAYMPEAETADFDVQM